MTNAPPPPVAMPSSEPVAATRHTAVSGLAPLVAIIFCGFLAVGAPLAALSLTVRDDLGFGTVMVGWVVGLQSLATVVTRHRSGTICDHQGPRRAVLFG